MTRWKGGTNVRVILHKENREISSYKRSLMLYYKSYYVNDLENTQYKFLKAIAFVANQ